MAMPVAGLVAAAAAGTLVARRNRKAGAGVVDTSVTPDSLTRDK